MNTEILKKIGLTDNEIKIYTTLLKTGLISAYALGRKTSIYRVHVYDKLEQLMSKGLVTYVNKGAKRYYQATHPEKLKQLMDEKKKQLDLQEQEVDKILPELIAMTELPREDTFVEVFKGKEGLKYVLNDTHKTKGVKEILITGIDDEKYKELLPVFMKQIFRELKRKKIKERVITVRKPGVFLFDKIVATTTTYRFLDQKQFNPTNTFVYADKVVIVTWGEPVMAVMIKNKDLAETYRNHFEHLWKIAEK